MRPACEENISSRNMAWLAHSSRLPCWMEHSSAPQLACDYMDKVGWGGGGREAVEELEGMGGEHCLIDTLLNPKP